MIAEALGKPLMEWQQHVADVALEIDPVTGRFAYREVLLTVPRRSGKSTLLLAVLIHRMLAMGRPQVAAFTMQNGLQARMRMRREWHDEMLSRSPTFSKTYEPSWATGAEALMFHNGSRLEVSASTESSGHGLTLDLAVVDEAFGIPDDRLEQAFRPAIRTQPDAQLWWVSTAGSPTDVWFRSKVEQARQAVDEPRSLAVFEWSAPEDADPADPDVWRGCMPALGHLRPDGSGLREQDIAEDFTAMSATSLDGFRRAYLNQWVARQVEDTAFADAWPALADPNAARSAPVSFGLAVAPDRAWSAIAVAWKRPDEATHVVIADYRPGTAWVTARAAELIAQWGGTLTASTSAQGLVPGALEPSQGVQARAHTGLDDAVRAGTIRHDNETALNVSVKASRWKAYGDTRMFDRKGSTDITPLDAAALAVHGLTTRTSTGGWVMSL